MKKLALVLGALSAPLIHAADETVTIGGENGLWSKLGINFGELVNDVFEAMSTPIGIVVMVVFTMAIFYTSVGLVRRGFNPSRRL